ncbi:MAG TPA: AraC family transcriptional regulator [Burkholderiales bacterium]
MACRREENKTTAGMAAVLLAAVLGSSGAALAEDGVREQVKGLDEQIQEVKADVLAIAAELSRLEEKLLYPSDTQVSLFVALAPAATFRLDAIEIHIDGKPVAYHLYTHKELEALRQGGVQRLYTGNIRQGEHELRVSVLGKSRNGTEHRWSGSFKLAKGVGPKLASITISGPSGQGIALKDW